jgi:ubiquinol-cytochrome c reductase cytochrome b subunit
VSGSDKSEGSTPADGPGTNDIDESGNLMSATRRYAEKYWPYNRLLPSDEPAYVSKLFYMFGSLALMSFIFLIATGVILVMKGVYWNHNSNIGWFFNSLHFWSCQIFFFAIFVHFGSSFFTAAWRGGRGLTWLFGATTFFIAILTGLTGYVLQSNYDAQWIGQQAKDAMNAVGLGGLLNLMNLDIVTGWHTILLPLGVTLFLGLHLLWVRRHGVVPPFPPDGMSFEGAPEVDGPTSLEASSSTHAGYEPVADDEVER